MGFFAFQAGLKKHFLFSLVTFHTFFLWSQKKVLPLHPLNEMGKSYTASSLGIPPGLDRSKGTRL